MIKMKTNKLEGLLKKLADADEYISTSLDNMDLAKEFLVPKWKIWLLLRIFGKQENVWDQYWNM